MVFKIYKYQANSNSGIDSGNSKFNIAVNSTRRYITMKRLLVGFLTLIPGIASADWYIDLKGPDVFGEKSAMLIGQFSNSKDGLRFDCTGDGQYSIMWMISSGEPMYNVRSLTTNIVMKTDQAKALSVSAVLQSFNETYIAAKAENDPAIISMLTGIAEASVKIDVGYMMPEIGKKASGVIGATGSTSAVRQFKEQCGLNNE